MGTDKKVLFVFARTIKDVKYRVKRSEHNKTHTIKKIIKTGQDSVGNNKYSVFMLKRKR